MIETSLPNPHIGAIVTGVDVRNMSGDDFAAIYDAWLKHNVVCVRGQNLTMPEFLAYSRRFGRVKPHLVKRTRHPEYPDITVMGVDKKKPDGTLDKSILTRGVADPGCVTVIPINRRNEGTRWRLRNLDRGQLLMRGTEIPYDNQTSRNACIEALVVPGRVLEQAAEILTAGRTRVDSTTWQSLRPDPVATMRLHARIAAILAPRGPAAGFSSSEQALAHIEAETLRCLVETIESCMTSEEHGFSRNRAGLVAKSTEIMRANLSGSLTALDLCVALGVSDRLLRLAFKETHGMGPIAFYRVMRLHAIRDALGAARGRDLRIGDILRDHGVTRPAAFAGEYRRHFGELPSETIGLR